MRRSVGPDQSAPVKGKDDWQVLQGDIVQQLVVTALQEGRVNRQHRPQALAGKARRKGDGVLLGDADVKIARREALGKAHHAGAFAHRRGDGNKAVVGRRHVAQPVPENLRITGPITRFLAIQPQVRLEFRDAVVTHRVGFGQLVALPFFGDDVQELRPRKLLQVLQGGDQRVEVMAVNRADVVETEFLEQRTGTQQSLDVAFDAVGEFEQRRCDAEHLFSGLACGVEGAAGEDARQMLVQRPDRR